VLLVAHDASQTGAPALAATWARWARAHASADVHVVALRGGPLLGALAGEGTASVASGVEALAAAALGAPAHAARLAWAARRCASPPVVVANTVAAWAAAATVRRRRALVCWVHELDGVADQVVGEAARTALLAQTDRFVAAGVHVAEMLIARWGVDPARVTTVDPFVDPLPDGFVARGSSLQVLGAGSVVPRKGVDAFVSTLALVAPTLPDRSAAWVGGPLVGPYASLVLADRRDAALDHVLDLPGPQASLEAWWPGDGILLHAAREDAAPLVVLEAAQRGVPVVTWETGGAADLVRRAGLADLVAPAGDLLGLAERASGLLADADRRRAAGAQLVEAAAERSTERLAPEVWRAVCEAQR
jgi:glycosyltransferase involved in cell wall biosynthesis